MTDLNELTMIGRLTKDAELKKFNEENGVIQFSIAVNRAVKKDGQYSDEAYFFNVKRYGKSLDKLTSYLTKGKQVAIGGYLKQDRWETDGKKNSATVIIAEHLQLLNVGGNTSSAPANNDGFPENIPYDESGDCPF